MNDKTYGYKDFIKAFIMKERFKDALPELRDYHSGLYGHLRDIFGVDLDSLANIENIRFEPGGLDLLFRRTLDCYLNITSPFSGILEAPKKICDLYEAYGGRIGGQVDTYRKTCFELMCELFRIIFGVVDKRITSDDLIALGFDDSLEPDESDFL